MPLILGIDPGSRKCGYGLVAVNGLELSYVACGVIRVETLAFPDRLQAIFSNLCDIIEEFSPQVAAIEEVFVGKSMSSALKLGQARGVAMVACSSHKLEIHEYAARKVKQALVGTGVADKNQMQQMIRRVLKLSVVPKEDAADALCVAVCHAHTQRTLIRLAGVRSGRRGRLLALPK
ncbi:MAG: crossover junction endodeoxyribonuclease RuvC [Pseudomonadota bacterium]